MSRSVAMVAVAMLVWTPDVLPAQTGSTGAATGRSAILEQGRAELAAGRRAEAAMLFRSAAEKHGSVQAMLELARIQAGDQQPAEALKMLINARSLAPNSEDVLYAFAQVALGSRLVVPAILALQPLTRMAADVADYHYLLGVALMQAGDMIPAGESLERAERLDPDRPLTLVALGLVLNNRKSFAEARTFLTRALEREPDSAEAHAALAEAEHGLGEAVAAQARARRVLERAPNNATALLVLGMTLLEQSQLPDARDAFEKAAMADPVTPKPNYQLSLVYARLGDQAGSQKHLDIYKQKLQTMNANLERLRMETGMPRAAGMGR